jgi:hypothetical protein
MNLRPSSYDIKQIAGESRAAIIDCRYPIIVERLYFDRLIDRTIRSPFDSRM